MQLVSINLDEFQQLTEKLANIENQIQKLTGSSTSPLSEQWVDNDAFCKIMGICKRSAQTWRDEARIGHAQFKNKIWYRKSDIQKFMEQNYKPAYKNSK